MNNKIQRETQTNLEYLVKDNQAKKAVILFHGYGANMQDLYGLNDLIENHTEYDWYFPNGPMPLMLGGGMSRAWFPIDVEALELAMASGTHRGYADKYPEQFKEVLGLCETFIQNISKQYDELYLGGFSQGAMVATHLTFTKNITVKALICFSGTLIGKDILLKTESKNHNIPFFQSHGKQDAILSFEQAKDLFELLKLDGHTGEFIGFQGGHEIPFEVIKKWSEFMKRLSR